MNNENLPYRKSELVIISYCYYKENVAKLLRRIKCISYFFDSKDVVFLFVGAPSILSYISEVLDRSRRNDIRSFMVEYDGKNWEFGAYQLGLDAVRNSYSRYILINDTHPTNYPFGPIKYLKLIWLLASNVNEPIVAGVFDKAESSHAIIGMRFSKWIRSNLIYFNYQAGEQFSWRVLNLSLHSSFVLDLDDRIQPVNNSFSESLVSRLNYWLFSKGSNDAWYKAAPLTGDNIEYFRMKIFSILNEKYFSARIQSLEEIRLYDLNSKGILGVLDRVYSKLSSALVG